MTTRWPAVVAVAGTSGIGGAAAVLSFAALCDLAARSGVAVPALWPGIVDGVVIVATVAVVAGAGWYAWSLLIIGAIVSVSGNIVHAAIPDGVLPVWLCATVAAVPPVALVAVTHLAVHLRRAGSTSAVACDISTTESELTRGSGLGSSLGELVRDSAPGAITPEVADVTAAPVLSHRDIAATPTGAPVPIVRVDGTARAHALELLASGVSAQAVAERLGIHRTTVYRWKRSPTPD